MDAFFIMGISFFLSTVRISIHTHHARRVVGAADRGRGRAVEAGGEPETFLRCGQPVLATVIPVAIRLRSRVFMFLAVSYEPGAIAIASAVASELVLVLIA
jgi:hypothetical protein